MPFVKAVSAIGELAIKPINSIGSYTLFISTAIKNCFFPPVKGFLLFRQMEFVGNKSFGIIVISAVMIGAVIVCVATFQKRKTSLYNKVRKPIIADFPHP